MISDASAAGLKDFSGEYVDSGSLPVNWFEILASRDKALGELRFMIHSGMAEIALMLKAP